MRGVCWCRNLNKDYLVKIKLERLRALRQKRLYKIWRTLAERAGITKWPPVVNVTDRFKDSKDPEIQRLLAREARARTLYADCSPTCTGWIEALKDDPRFVKSKDSGIGFVIVGAKPWK